MKIKINSKKSDDEDDKPLLNCLFRSADWKDYSLLFGGIFLSFVNGALLPCDSLIFSGITNALIDSEAKFKNETLDMQEFSETILPYCLRYVYLGAALFTSTYFANACLYTMCERRLHSIRKQFLEAVLHHDAQWFDKQSSGELNQKISSGIEKIKDGIGDKMGLTVSACGTLLSSIVLGSYLCWRLTLVMLISGPIQIVVMYIAAGKLSKATVEEMSKYGEAGSIAGEVISGIRTVMAFNAQNHEIKRYSEQLDEAKNSGIRKAKIIAIVNAIPFFLMFIIMAVAFWYGAVLVTWKLATPGVVFGVFWAVFMGVERMSLTAQQFGALTACRTAIRDVYRIIDSTRSIDCMSLNGIKPNSIKGLVEFDNVEFTYPHRPETKVLKGVTFKMEPGKTVAVIGPSGSGKSTIVGLLTRMYTSTEGKIKLDGNQITDINIEFLRQTIGIVQQELVVIVASIRENIRLGDHSITDDDIKKACIMANAHEFIENLHDGYDTIIGHGGVQLSVGQKQRLAIARALVRNPKILILDEATSALDSESEQIVQKSMENASKGRTTLCIAHRLSTIRNADLIIVLKNGEIVEQGNHNELMNEDSIYKAMVNAQKFEKSSSTSRESDKPTKEEEDNVQSVISSKSTLVKTSSIEILSPKLGKVHLDPESSSTEEIETKNKPATASHFEILKYSRPEWTKLFLGLAFTSIRGLTWPVFSLVYGKLFRIFSENPDDIAMRAFFACIWFVVIAVSSGITTYLSGSLLGISGESMSSRLRLDVFKNIVGQDAEYFDNAQNNVGALTTRLATDASNVQAAVDQRLAEVLTGLVSLFAGVCIAFYFGWNIAIVGVTTAIFLVICQLLLAQYLKHRGQVDVEAAVEPSRVFNESISNWKTIQLLTKQEYMINNYRKSAKVQYRRALTKGLWQALSYAISESYWLWSFAFVYSMGVWFIVNHWSSPFIVFQVIESLNMAIFSIIMAASYFPEYIRARISAATIFDMINRKPTMSFDGIKPEITGNIELDNVHFAYPNRRKDEVLKGLTLSVNYGETLAIVGPSGSGKSTTIQLIERYYDIIGGSLKVDGNDIDSIDIKHLRSHISLVGQEPVLFNVTIRDNICYGLNDVSQEQVERAARLANIHEFICNLPQGYDTKVGASACQLSGGQKQRISIARAIIRDPRILLLDEATSALDTQSEKAVQEALEAARHGRTCVVIAHRLSTIQNADKIVVCKHGRVVEEGNHQNLMEKKGLYYRLVDKQIS